MSRLSIAFGFAISILIAALWGSHANTVRLLDAEAERDHARMVIVEIQTLLGEFVDAETGARGFALTGDERFLEPQRRAAADLPRRVAALVALTVDDAIASGLVRDVERRGKDRLAIVDDVIRIRRERGLEAVQAEVASMRGVAVMDDLRSLLGRLEATELRLLADRTTVVLDCARRVDLMLMVVRVVAIGVLLLVFLGLRREIRRRRAAELALHATEERLRLAVEGADLAILRWDLRRDELSWSDRGLRIFGIEGSGPMPRERFARLVHPDDLPGVIDARRLALAGKPDYDLEFRVCPSQGGTRWIAVTGRVDLGADGKPDVMQGVGRDVTVRHQAQEDVRTLAARLATSNAELVDANKELEAFSYSVSHDLRAPLRSIDGFSLALVEDAGPRLLDDERGHLQRIRAATRRMSQLIDDLLELSRVGRSELRREDVDLSSTARSVVEEIRASEPGRKVDIDIEADMHGLGDPRLLRLVLTNLFANAWKYTSKTPLARIWFGTEGQPEDRTFVVQDNGVGFDVAYAQKLFGVFQRLHNEAEFPGTGVGLAIVQRIVHRHGGQISGEGRPGEGATFRFTLGPKSAPGEGEQSA